MKKTFLLFAVCLSTATFNELSAQITNPAPYCVATFDDDPFLVDDAIISVAFFSMSNVTPGQAAAPHYTYYNNVTAPIVQRGSSYPLTVKFDVKGGAGYGVWIDFNGNKTFEASERVSGSPKDMSLDITSSTTITKSVLIPSTAALGVTRMRVRIVEDDNYTMGANGYAIAACNASTSATDVMDWGETEDYNINIMPALGINENVQTQNFVIFPNPVTNVLNINQGSVTADSYKIFNLLGQQVLSGNLDNKQIQISVTGLPAATYILRLANDNQNLGQQTFVKTAQ